MLLEILLSAEPLSKSHLLDASPEKHLGSVPHLRFSVGNTDCGYLYKNDKNSSIT